MGHQHGKGNGKFSPTPKPRPQLTPRQVAALVEMRGELKEMWPHIDAMKVAVNNLQNTHINILAALDRLDPPGK